MAAVAILACAGTVQAYVVLTGPPASDIQTSTQTVCSDLITINLNGLPVNGTAVCATATSTTRFDCADADPGFVTCVMSWTLTGGGYSPLNLPGSYHWDGVTDWEKCWGNEQGERQICLAPLAIWFEDGAWPGLPFGSQADNTQVITDSITLPLNYPIQDPHCYLIDGAAGLTVKAKAEIPGVLTLAQATASAGTSMVKPFC